METDNFRKIIEFLGVDPLEYLLNVTGSEDFSEDVDQEVGRLLSFVSVFTDYAKVMTYSGIMTTLEIMELLSQVPSFQRKEGETLGESRIRSPLPVHSISADIEAAFDKAFSGRSEERTVTTSDNASENDGFSDETEYTSISIKNTKTQ